LVNALRKKNDKINETAKDVICQRYNPTYKQVT